jgi:ABC-type Na+ efflux pump permease subunit
MGGNPKGLKIGIVDKEIMDYSECDKSTLISTIPHDYTCDLHLISCRFLDELTDDIVTKVFYQTFEEAYKSARRGELTGIIEIDTNFTDALQEVRRNPKAASAETRQSSSIKIYMDQSDLQITFFLQRQIFNSYKRYSQNVLADCQLPLKLDNVPMDFSETLFGSIDADFRHTMLPPFVMLIVFVLSAGLTLSGIIMERKEGFWNRTLLAGVSTIEILSAHVIINVIIVIIQLVEVLVLLTFIYGTYNQESYFIVSLMLGLLGCCGILFGLFISCLCTELMQANLLMMGITQPMTALSGMIWPVEGKS